MPITCHQGYSREMVFMPVELTRHPDVIVLWEGQRKQERVVGGEGWRQEEVFKRDSWSNPWEAEGKVFSTLSLGSNNCSRFCPSKKAIKLLVEGNGHGPSSHHFTLQPLGKGCWCIPPRRDALGWNAGRSRYLGGLDLHWGPFWGFWTPGMRRAFGPHCSTGQTLRSGPAPGKGQAVCVNANRSTGVGRNDGVVLVRW